MFLTLEVRKVTPGRTAERLDLECKEKKTINHMALRLWFRDWRDGQKINSVFCASKASDGVSSAHIGWFTT